MRPAYTARERMGVALERYARADRNVVPRGSVSIEPDAPEQFAIDQVNH
jgi:hypothetical protein